MADGRPSDLLYHLRRAFRVHLDAGLNDGQLLESFLAQRNETAFAMLVQRHAAMVLGVCRRVLRHGQDAEDAFQATFLVLVRKAAGLCGRRTVGNWLYGVAHRTALKARAARGRRRFKEQQMVLHRKQPAPVPEPNDWLPFLDEALSGLPDRYRQAVVMCDLEGKSRKEAACLLGWPEGTLSGRLARARVLLARRLTRRGVVLSGGAVAGAMSMQAAAPASAALVIPTVQAAVAMTNPAPAVGALSVPVLSLVEGVVRSMFMTKLKIAAALILTVGAVGGGAGMLRKGGAADVAVKEPIKSAQAPAKLVPVTGPARRNEEVEEILKRVVSLHFQSVPLRKVLEDISTTMGLNILMDRQALENMSVDENHRITWKLDNVMLQTALRLALKDLNLGYIVQEGVLIITQAREKLVQRIYPVADLVTGKDNKTCKDELIHLITEVIEPQTWSSMGGYGTIQFYPLGMSLIVNQSPAVQQQIESLLAGLRAFKEKAN